jgi:hypothetical protein
MYLSFITKMKGILCYTGVVSVQLKIVSKFGMVKDSALIHTLNERPVAVA